MLIDKAIDGYKYNELNGKLGIFGNPIAHTLSPIIHDNLSLIFQNNEKYIPFKIEKDLNKYVYEAYNSGILGLNITVPYKQEVIGTLIDIDDDAKKIGAVNTLVRTTGGYKGYNTDMPGLARAIISENIKLNDSKVIILGAGGAARAVAYMCGKYNCKAVYIINRTYDNARKLCDDMKSIFYNCDFVACSSENYNSIPKDKYLFIQSTSVGLKPTDGIPLISDESFYDMAVAGVDLIYNPAVTPFIRLLADKGIKTMNGLKMLLYQGIMAYELWNNIEINDDIAMSIYRKLCYVLYDKPHLSIENRQLPNKIILVGYMGSGKTTVGKKLAKQLGYNFVDTDEYIVEKEGRSISDIFRDSGEEYFRNLETSIIDELNEKYSNCIISTGGGMPLRKENREKLLNMGKVYFLNASADTIYIRVKNSTDRPLLAGDKLYDKIKKMLWDRMDKYCFCSDYVIDANMDVESIIKSIV